MTEPTRDLVAEEGVDLGSAAASSEGDAGPDPEADAVLGEPASGRPVDGEQDAAPEPIGGPDLGPGQRQQVGEG